MGLGYQITALCLLSLTLRPSLYTVAAAGSATDISGSAATRRYWDCCKPSCSWKGKADFNEPARTCDIHDNPLADFEAGTGCNLGTAFTCTNQSPWAVNDTFSYGFAGAYIMGHTEDFWCCSCFELNFTSGSVQGKRMIIQAQNTAYDTTTENRFILGIPGGNVSEGNGCATQFGVPLSTFGQTNVGVTSRSDCDSLPEKLRPGCYWRFDWFKDADEPNVDFKRVTCPTELTNLTGCIRHDESKVGTTSSAPPGSATHQSTLLVATVIYIAFILL